MHTGCLLTDPLLRSLLHLKPDPNVIAPSRGRGGARAPSSGGRGRGGRDRGDRESDDERRRAR